MRRVLLGFWYLLAALVVLMALGFSIGRLVLPLLDAPNSRLEALVRDTVGQDVHIGRLELAWRGFGPELRVYDVTIGNGAAAAPPLLSARELRIGVSLPRSLWARRPVAARLVLLGSEISAYRDAAGKFAVQGLHFNAAQANPWALVLAQPRVELRDIRLHWRDELKVLPDATLDDIDLRLRNRGARHQLELDLRLPPEYGASLQVAADLSGTADRPAAWRGAVYVAVADAPLANWAKGRLPHDWQMHGALTTQLWAGIENGAMEYLQGNVTVAGPRLTRAALSQPVLQGHRLNTQIDWRRAQNGWTLALEQFDWQTEHGAWPRSGLTLAAAPAENGARRWHLAVDRLHLDPLLPLLAHVPAIAADQRKLLGRLQPGGEVNGLRLAFTLTDVPSAETDTPPTMRLDDLRYRADFSNVHSAAVDKLPGVAALSGRVWGAPERGVLELASRDARVILPKLFREPLQFDTLSGRIDWQRRDDRLQIGSARLDVGNADIRTVSRFRLDVPADGTRPVLDVQTHFTDGLIESAHKYLPAGIMPPRTLAWLDRALVSGNVRGGHLLLHGRLGDFPFDRATGRMEVRATVGDAVLDYGNGWHRIEGLEAELAFVNRSMRIRGVAGQVLGSEIRDVDVRIDDLAHAQLNIRGGARGGLADMLRFVEESPLGDGGLGATLGKVEAAGDAALSLDLRIPLGRSLRGPVQVNGTVQFDGNRLGLPTWDIAVDRLAGALSFTRDGFGSRDLRGRLLGMPVRLEVGDGDVDGHPATQARARGRLPLLERARGHVSKSLAARLEGDADWTATFAVPRRAPAGVEPRLELQSDLQGVRVDLPAPFGKSAKEARPLRLRADLRAGGLGGVYAQYAGHSAAALMTTEAGVRRVTRGTLVFGADDARLPDVDGLYVSGRLPLFDWSAWRPLVDSAGDGDLIRAVNVTFDELRAFDRTFHALHVQALRPEGRWQAQVNGPDIDGTVELPTGADPSLRLRFARLHIPVAEKGAVTQRVDPASLPALDLDVEKLRFRDLELGHVVLATHPIATGMRVDKVQVAADWTRFAGDGEWTRTADQDASHFRIGLLGGDLGKLLASFGRGGSVEGGETKGRIDAQWQDTPADFALSKLDGTLAMRIGKGRLLKVEAGAGRMFGLVSLQGLQRRLALDFSDVFAKGFAFDRIEGHFTLQAGDAHTKDLVIEGPAARIEISGRTGLARHDYDQLVTVIPRVQSGLPIAGAIAGGPVVGAALLLADQIFSEQIEELTSFARYQYKVTGSWENPQYTPVPRQPARGLPDSPRPAAPEPSEPVTPPPQEPQQEPQPRTDTPGQDNE